MIWFNLMMILYLSDSLRGDLSYCHNATLEITLRVASFFGILKDGVEIHYVKMTLRVPLKFSFLYC